MAAPLSPTDHTGLTGDDRGGIAFANGSVYYSGDDSTAHFLGSNLSSNSRLGTIYNGMFSTFSDGKLYTMSDSTGYAGSVLLLGAGFLGVAAARRRKRA